LTVDCIRLRVIGSYDAIEIKQRPLTDAPFYAPMTATNMFAAVSILSTGAVAAHCRRTVEMGSRTPRAAKLLVRTASCLAMLGLASAATAQQPAPNATGERPMRSSARGSIAPGNM
jgi:hypothetical protein